MTYGKHIVAETPKDDVVVILGTFEAIKGCDALVTGYSGFSWLLREQIVDAGKDRGREVFLGVVDENFTSPEARQKSGEVIAKKLEEAKAAAGLLRR